MNPAITLESASIDGSISDLFFNLDFSDCYVLDPDEPKAGKYLDETRLLEKATWFCETIGNLGVLVDVDALVADFRRRY